jgi:hypothetical protein
MLCFIEFFQERLGACAAGDIIVEAHARINATTAIATWLAAFLVRRAALSEFSEGKLERLLISRRRP